MLLGSDLLIGIERSDRVSGTVEDVSDEISIGSFTKFGSL